MSNDGIKWHAFAKVFKFSDAQTADLAKKLGRQPVYLDFVAAGVESADYAEADGNLLTTVGLQRITNLIIGAAGQAFSVTGTNRAMAGVGNSATAAAIGDTSLTATGAGNAWYQGLDATATAVNGVITANTTFGVSDGNFAWQEWGWAIATANPVAANTFATATTSGILLNHKVQSLGTKSAGSTWTLQATITLS